MDWKWKIGFLSGYGECIWQELAGNIRRITRPIAMPNGQLALVKALPCVASVLDSPQFPADKMVIAGLDCRDELAHEAERCWTGGAIVPVNGQRFKLS